MQIKSFFILVVAALLLSACESSIIESVPSIDESTTLAYSGGLNVTFSTDIKEFNKSIRVISQGNDSYLLDLQMNVRIREDLQNQLASLQFDIPFDSEDGIFPEGNYILTSEQIKTAIGSYELNKNNGDFARYNFKGKSATLVIRESTAKYIAGSFIIDMDQLYGKRMIDGQLEDVTLNSPNELQSHFYLEY